MKTTARRDGSDWVLNGEKRWIGLATIADVAVVWARTDEEKNPVRGFLVPTDAPGFAARDITPSSRCAPPSSATSRSTTCASPGTPCSPKRAASAALRLPQRGPLRHHLGRDGRGEGLLRVGARLRKEREQFGNP
jgi:hypothetical protein